MIIEPRALLFLDTEFTSLGEPWPVHLISAGLSDSQGHCVFYAESDDFDPWLVSVFTRNHVLPLLERGAKSMPYEALCDYFFQAIEHFGKPCALAADSNWDWLWVQMMAQGHREAIGPLMADNPSCFPRWPSNLSPAMACLSFESLSAIDKLACDKASEAYFKHKFPHHALADAIGNALCAKAAIEAHPGLDPDQPKAFCHVFKQSFEALSWTSNPTPRLGA